jgi:cytochrome c-type biogenesis protein CcmE
MSPPTAENLPRGAPVDAVAVMPESEADARAAVRRTPAKRRRSGLLVVVPLVMISAAAAALVLGGMKDKAIYSKPVDELVAQKGKFAGRPVRAEGTLVHGSLTKRETPCEYRFTITRNGVDVPVRFAECIVPDTFRDEPGAEVGVTVEGELQADNTFEATSVLAKCPSKYETKAGRAKGEPSPGSVGDIPHGTM